MEHDTERNPGRIFPQNTETALKPNYREVDNYKGIRRKPVHDFDLVKLIYWYE